MLALWFAIFSAASASSPDACHAKGTCDAATSSAMLQIKVAETPSVKDVKEDGKDLNQDWSLVDMESRRSCISQALQTAKSEALSKQNPACNPADGPGKACKLDGVDGKCALPGPPRSTDIQYTGDQLGNYIFCDIGQGCKGPADSACTVNGGLTGTCKQTGTSSMVTGNQPLFTCKDIKQGTSEPEPQPGLGATASLDAAGFKAVTSLCCPTETETFFNRVLGQKDHMVCSKPHVQGLMHWFTCVPDMDFQYMLDVIANGNPCKYWSPKGTECPALSSSCQGEWCR